MTIGEKLKEARKNAGLTQEQLADKLMVSRAAVAKWETDKGTPDIENLKAIAAYLDVSIDYLVDAGHTWDANVTKEAIDLSQYGKGRKKVKKDKIVREKFPEEAISTLVVEKVLTKSEKLTDNAIGFLTSAPFGIPQFIHQMRLTGNEYYLVEREGVQFLVTVSDEFIETRRLIAPVDNKRGSRFVVGDLRFTNCGPICYA